MLFPQARAIALSKAKGVALDTIPEQSYILAVVDTERRLPTSAQATLHQWLKVRIGADSLRLLTTP